MKVKKNIVTTSLLIIICLVPVSCKLALYPLARMFGGPKESELRVIRQNFIRLQENISTSKMAVFPPCIINYQKHEWKPGVAKQLVKIMEMKKEIDAYEVSIKPEVEFIPVGRNQLRFMWDRARAYSSWVIKAQPVQPGEFIMFTDFICSPDSNCHYVGGVQIYITDSQGNISYTSLINSKHGIYNKIKPHSLKDCCVMAIKRFLEGLSLDVMVLYPPYGVG